MLTTNGVKLHTEVLFYLLLGTFRPGLVCDIGSMDGLHARRFRSILPDSRIVAFEANPRNASLIRENPDVARRKIEVRQAAAWNEDGYVTFHIESAPERDRAEAWRRGTSSTRSRLAGSLGDSEIRVESVRLDTFMRRQEPPPAGAGLWIDVEGAAFEVLEGLAGARELVQAVHVEVETRAVWQRQKLKPEVERLMVDLGFDVLGRGFVESQHDLVFIGRRLHETYHRSVNAIILFARLLTYLSRFEANTVRKELIERSLRGVLAAGLLAPALPISG